MVRVFIKMMTKKHTNAMTFCGLLFSKIKDQRIWTEIDPPHPLTVKNFLDTQVSLAPTPVSLSVRMSVSDTFGFPFCQHLWDLTKRWDDIAVADMVVDKKMVDMELDIVADMAADKKMADMELDMVANMQIGKVADMFNTKCVKSLNVLKRSALGRSCLMRSVPDLRVF